ncbi:MAG: endolytic transglycosylase MltG [Ignavibacteriales bacterium]|nr:endolytic transglycosylase MltG [Ignavibacteriales bacterium]
MSSLRDHKNRILIGAGQMWAVKSARVTIVAAGVVVFIVLSFSIWIFLWPNWFSGPPERVIHVARGDTFNRVTDSLYTNGIIRSKQAFKIAGRMLGLSRELKVGRYSFPSGLSNLTILYALRDGTSRKLIPVSLPEGIRMTFVAGRLGKELGVDSTRIMDLCTDSSLVAAWGISAPSLEGYLLPDTYFFHWQTEELSVVERFLQAFREFYSDSLLERQRQLGMSTHQVVTFASIVERETQMPWERAVVAGVYHNRLARGMRLEADPTIQYVLPDGPRRLMYSDLRIESAYNTYRIRGLPPGPIGNPGRDAILASLYPERHEYLYFVADGTGGHRFSKSYSEHLRAVREYRRVRREMQRQANAGG